MTTVIKYSFRSFFIVLNLNFTYRTFFIKKNFTFITHTNILTTICIARSMNFKSTSNLLNSLCIFSPQSAIGSSYQLVVYLGEVIFCFIGDQLFVFCDAK